MNKLRAPAVVVNFKAYGEVEGEKAVALAEACQDVADDTGANLVVCPPLVELSAVAKAVTLPVLSQHVDNKKPGAATGWVTPEMIRSAGCSGSLLNHAERKLVLADIASTIAACRAVDMQILACADTELTSAALASLEPDMIAVEPPELIGGEVSVTSANPNIVRNAVMSVHRIDESIPVLCGAGVKTGQDVKKAIELGASGVLLASGVVKSKDPRKILHDLVQYI